MTIKLTRLDLDYILTQIQMAEDGQPPVNPLLSFGLREVAGTNNNWRAGPEHLRLVGPGVPDADRSRCSRPRRPAPAHYCADQRSGRRLAAAPDQPADRQPEAVDSAGADGILGAADDTFVSGKLPPHSPRSGRASFLAHGYQNTLCPARTASTARPTTPARRSPAPTA